MKLHFNKTSGNNIFLTNYQKKKLWRQRFIELLNNTCVCFFMILMCASKNQDILTNFDSS